MIMNQHSYHTIADSKVFSLQATVHRYCFGEVDDDIALTDSVDELMLKNETRLQMMAGRQKTQLSQYQIYKISSDFSENIIFDNN